MRVRHISQQSTHSAFTQFAPQPQDGQGSGKAGMLLFGVALFGGLICGGVQIVHDLSQSPQAMLRPYVLPGAALLVALSFEFVNGFHDHGKRSGDRDLHPLARLNIAVVWPGMWNLIGVLTSPGGVAWVVTLPAAAVLAGCLYWGLRQFVHQAIGRSSGFRRRRSVTITGAPLFCALQRLRRSMGVRGKIEAVIYAAEEPVTLAQLTALFGEEALAARLEALSADAIGDQNEPGTAAAQLPLQAEQAEAAAAEETQEAAPAAQAPEAESAADAAVQPPESSELDSSAEPDAEAEKRAARARERQQREAVRAELAALMAEYDAGDRGMEIREIAGGYRVATKPEYHDAVRAFAKSLKPPMKLTLQALETLAVIAYKQPVTAPEVSEIRGVDSGGVMGSLISRKLVTTAGRKQVLGRPILYKTTKEFLLRFGLKDLAELPSMEEFEKMAGELQGLSDEPEREAGQDLLPADAPEPSETSDAETQGSAARHGAPAVKPEPELEAQREDLALEVPQEPAQSIIVVDDAEPVEQGVQVTEEGTAVSDDSATETTDGPEAHDHDEVPATADEKEENNHG